MATQPGFDINELMEVWMDCIEFSSSWEERIERFAEILVEPHRKELAAVTAERDMIQAKLDTLMLEFCPDEMTVEQRVRWEKAQARAADGGKKK